MENNVNLKLYGCLRTNPLEIKIPYITPTTDTVSASNRIIVNSIYSDIPRFTTQSFTEGAIYYYNPSTKQFANVTTTPSSSALVFTVVPTGYLAIDDSRHLIILLSNLPPSFSFI